MAIFQSNVVVLRLVCIKLMCRDNIEETKVTSNETNLVARCRRVIDLRQSALCDKHSKLFEEHEAPGSRSFFTEIIASISDIKFGRDGRYILSLMDSGPVHEHFCCCAVMNSGPVSTFQVHEHLRPKLCDFYENDSIFDKFECFLSGDSKRVATGSYSNLFRVFGCHLGSTEATTLEASKNPMRRQVHNPGS
ncbi:hypothetical protein L2E82_48279 [Cichorium intybus]|uniref:Uncharacterized protein n=1 Tax=Cichorium intybus TaxID=13427 RepID=A0ACB8YX15_CICIN|nr:hypothetical protein L2E82_48279 [Cichorium intybus]